MLYKFWFHLLCVQFALLVSLIVWMMPHV